MIMSVLSFLVILIVAAVIYLAASGKMEIKDAITIFMAIIVSFTGAVLLILGYYFGTKGSIVSTSPPTQTNTTEALSGK